MHATTQQLLSLRDREPVGVDVQQHVTQCPECQQALNHFQSMKLALRQWSDIDSRNIAQGAGIDLLSDAAWESIQQGLDNKRRLNRRRRFIGQFSIAASIVVCAMVTFTLWRNPEPNDPLLVTDAQLRHFLMQRNVALEQAISQLPQPRKIVSGGTAHTIASIEDQIAALDYQLSYRDQVNVKEPTSVELLQNRAELLNTLYNVRYGEAMVNLVSYQY